MKNVNKIVYLSGCEFLVDYDGITDILQTYDQIKRTASNLDQFDSIMKTFMRELLLNSLTKTEHDSDKTVVYKSKTSSILDEAWGILDDLYDDDFEDDDTSDFFGDDDDIY